MRKPIIIAIAAAALIGATALPASAAPPNDTVTTFELTAGALTFTVTETATLGDEDTGYNDITGSLGPVSVADGRGGVVVWNASATSTPFVGDGSLPSSSTEVEYVAGTVTETGTITVADGTATTLDVLTPAPVVSPSALSGNNTASWNPTLNVTMPESAKADTYEGTVTTSVV